MNDSKTTTTRIYRLVGDDGVMLLYEDGPVVPFEQALPPNRYLLVDVPTWNDITQRYNKLRRSIVAYRISTLLTLVWTAVWLLSGCTVVVPMESCAVAHDSPGCNSPDIEGCVCDVQGDHPCCELQWDDVCVAEAQQCSACTTENDCTTNACIDGTCVTYEPQQCDACSATQGCDGVCDVSTSTCTQYCRVDFDCAAVHEWTCDDRGLCVWPCTVDADCAGGQMCNDGVCSFMGET